MLYLKNPIRIQNQIKIFICIFIIVLSASCNDIAEPESINKTNIDVGLLTINTEIDYSFFSCQSYTEMMIINDNDTIIPNGVYSYDRLDAYIEECDGVTYNGNSIGHLGSGTYHDAKNVFSFDGNYHVWNVDGDNDMVDILDSVVAPSAFSYITSPSTGSSLNRYSNLTITWSPYGGADVVSIQLLPGFMQYDNDGVTIETNDDGSYTIPSGRLNDLSSGCYTIILRRGNYIIGSSSNKNYFMGIWSQHLRDIHFYN